MTSKPCGTLVEISPVQATLNIQWPEMAILEDRARAWEGKTSQSHRDA